MRMTAKDRKIDELRNIVLARYEKAGIVTTPELANSIWYTLLGEYDRNGYDAAKNIASTAKLISAEKVEEISRRASR